MDSIKSAACGLCITAVAVGLVSYLAPKSGTGKTVNFVLRLFFLSVLIFCVCKTRLPEFSFSQEQPAFPAEEEGLSRLVEQQLVSSYQQKIAEMAEEALRNYLSGDFQTEAFVYISEDGVINISSIRILIPEGEEVSRQAVEKVEEIFGVCPEVVKK